MRGKPQEQTSIPWEMPCLAWMDRLPEPSDIKECAAPEHVGSADLPDERTGMSVEGGCESAICSLRRHQITMRLIVEMAS